MNKANSILQATDLLLADGFMLTDEMLASLGLYESLIQDCNERLSLVSLGDVNKIWESHIVDALSLAGYIQSLVSQCPRLLDIGSGAGLPAIPLMILMEHLQVTLLERGERKAAFLRHVIDELGLDRARVLCDQYPSREVFGTFDVITARAVDKPMRLLKGLPDEIEGGAVFLCQTAPLASALSNIFHVEHIEDDWTRGSLRRGDLWIVCESSQQELQ